MSNSTIKISSSSWKRKKNNNNNNKRSLKEIEYLKFQKGKRKYSVHSRRQKVFTRQYSIRNERLSSIPPPPPNKLYLPVIHDPCRKLEHPTRLEQKHEWERERERKNSPVRWKSFENTPSVGRWRKLKQSRCL